MLNSTPDDGCSQRRTQRRSGTAQQRERDLDARTLYLMPVAALHVSSTGEALVATLPDGEAQRLPVQRVLRVVCSERVSWSGSALGLCQAQGITVSWLDARGCTLGHLWPATAPRTDLADALDALAGAHGEWAQVYDNWMRHQRAVVLERWVAARGAADQPVSAEEARRAHRAWVYRNEVAEHLPPMLSGMISGLVAFRLADAGLLPRYWCVDGQTVELAADMTRLLWAELNLCGGPVAEAMRDPRGAAALFERWSTQAADALHAHLASLKAHALRQFGG